MREISNRAIIMAMVFCITQTELKNMKVNFIREKPRVREQVIPIPENCYLPDCLQEMRFTMNPCLVSR